MTTDVTSRLRATLAARLGDAFTGVADTDLLREALGDAYDSMSALECVTAVEEEFGIEVDLVADDVRHWFATVDRMAAFVTRRLEDAAVLRVVR
ncbi:acyl carrier protein [Micromonospora echinospora]|uniref:Acyl carrier protein n=1 Tax=Micromonospora echinospora TaxID=1877 RepID=A0A1C4ZA54_MICEC|nr:acyl carrier protein [Micromonospora echinospora]OZV80534.1 acyl carrier protein [Micromonospora echinospora]SCF29882.1 acyl carrier protein [Micromonospora echinospora]